MNLLTEFLNRFPRPVKLAAAAGVSVFAFSMGFFAAQYSDRKALNDFKSLQKEFAKTKSEKEKSRVDFTNLEKDRDNILIQTKRYIQDSNQLTETLEKHETLSKAHEALVKRSRGLERSHSKLLAQLLKSNKELKSGFEKARRSLRKLVPRNKEQKSTIDKLQTQIEDGIQKSPEFQELKRRLAQVTAEKAQLEQRLSEKAREVEALEKKLKEMKVYQDKYTEALQEIGRLESVKQGMEREQLNAPQRFKEIALQNKILVKETARMHYNLGSFYSESKRFDLALGEFKKAAELDPANFEAHYNLGLLYAGHFERHELAESHFKEYLELAPADPGVDWVRNYLASRQVYDAKVTKT